MRIDQTAYGSVARRMLGVVAMMVVAAAPVFAATSTKASVTKPKPNDDKQTARLKESEAVLKAAVTAPDKGIPKELLERAECIGVFPGLKKAAFVVGGEFGRGVFTCRNDEGRMGAPAFFSMGGPSVGWQFGGEEADVVLLIMNKEGMKHLLQDKFTVGGEASAAAGPVGRTAQAATDAQLHAQILAWSRSRGLFLGASIEGSIVRQDAKSIEAVYGQPLTAEDLLVHHKAPVPGAAKPFVEMADRWSRRDAS